jgi:RNA polymerase sigma factor (sigma-70 family)
MEYVDLVRRARIGDAAAFGSLVEAFQDMALGYAFSLLGNRHDAEDAAQEAFLQAFRNLGSLAECSAFPGWLKRIVQNASLALASARSRQSEELPDELPSRDADPPSRLEADAVMLRLDEALARLSEEERSAFVLYHLEERSYREIAAFLGTSETTVTNRLHKARKLVRKELIDMAEKKVESFRASRDEAFKRRVLGRIERVYYGQQEGHIEITPFPSCLRACLKALGEERLPSRLAYARALCHSGAAFRLMWNPARWDGGNVDIMAMDEVAVAPLRRAFEASGFEARLYANADARGPLPEGSSISEFARDFPAFLDEEGMRAAVVESIDSGRPVIAFGIIGPAEACIVTGYEDEGRLLLGWNFFQDFKDMNPEQDFDPAGYFRKRGWYANATAIALFGERRPIAASDARSEALALIDLALRVMSTRKTGSGAHERVSGQAAFKAWAEAMRSGVLPCGEGESPEEMRLMAHGDAMDMSSEGRCYAAEYLGRLAGLLSGDRAAAALEEAAAAFRAESGTLWEIATIAGGPQRGPEQLAALANGSTRAKISELILRAAAEEERASSLLARARALLA